MGNLPYHHRNKSKTGEQVSVVRTLLDDRFEEALKGLCLKHNGTGARRGVPAGATCLDRLSAALERVGDDALILYRLGLKVCFGESRYS
ncbi:hypothetical protein L3X38_000602 [Prunus dulcis]|uniref:Uncharacterized protein n=1 Tax=Prunus dulcis TaxID=3755 RepID=A0AAD4WQH1_PRUDU|nr:hypothetical protein L3X38_000602 [Prunus dulcis]